MENERGFIDPISITIFLVVAGLLLGGFLLTQEAPCDPKTQHCIDYPGGSFEAPTGQPREVTS